MLTVGFFGSGVLARSTLPTSDSLFASTVWLPVFGGFTVPPAARRLDGRRRGAAAAAAVVAAAALVALVGAGRPLGAAAAEPAGGRRCGGRRRSTAWDRRQLGRRHRQLGRRDRRRRASTGPRSVMLCTGGREARDLDLGDGSAGRDVDRDGQDLAGHERHLDPVHLGRGNRRQQRIEPRGDQRDEQLPSCHSRYESPPARLPARSCAPSADGRTRRTRRHDATDPICFLQMTTVNAPLSSGIPSRICAIVSRSRERQPKSYPRVEGHSRAFPDAHVHPQVR